MTEEQAELDWDRVEQLFHAALDLAPDARSAFIAEACAGDTALADEIDGLLLADDQSEGFLGESDRAQAAAPLLAEELPRRLGAYRLLEVIGEGGMGVVYGAERADGAYEQKVAVKMLRPGPATAGLLSRFDAERRTLARLEHPGIARLLDAGEDEHGSPWLAMELVSGGEPIDEWCDHRHLNVRARVELAAEMCDALAHAHDQLVVHRDLKPQNVLVDGEGRARLLDFGIAKVLQADADDLSLTETSERVLTPAYAAPEQVRGEPVGVRTDVYSLGVLLYELLTGARPHGAATTSRGELEREILEARADSPSQMVAKAESAQIVAAARSTSARGLQRELRGDLDRICLKALRKEPERRYGSAAELADELRRWLNGLPVRARGDGLRYRTNKFVRRHPVETALVSLLTVVGLAAAGAFVQSSLRDRDQLAEIQRLGDLENLAELRGEVDRLWPIHPDLVPKLEVWLDGARALTSRRDLHAHTLARWNSQHPELLTDAAGRGWNAWRADQLSKLVAELDKVLADDIYLPTVSAIEWRLERARSIAARSLQTQAEAWQACLARLDADPRFDRLEPLAQLGLVPLGQDPDGNLEAFWAVETGARPARDADGRLVPSADGGLVLLLIPAGTVLVGAQSDTPDAPRFDAGAVIAEGPPTEVELAPYLISKFEVTQGQWLRWTGSNPSDYLAGSTVGGREFGDTSPVERVSWKQAGKALWRLGLELPTEAQWEHAARAGSETVWATGDDERSLAGHVNIPDVYARASGGSAGWVYSDWLDDGHTVHAPVGSYLPNAFGLHDAQGNLWEWTRDRFFSFAEVPMRPGDGLRVAPAGIADDHPIVARGGGYGNPPSYLRSAYRYATSPTLESRSTGLRPARSWR